MGRPDRHWAAQLVPRRWQAHPGPVRPRWPHWCRWQTPCRLALLAQPGDLRHKLPSSDRTVVLANTRPTPQVRNVCFTNTTRRYCWLSRLKLDGETREDRRVVDFMITLWNIGRDSQDESKTPVSETSQSALVLFHQSSPATSISFDTQPDSLAALQSVWSWVFRVWPASRAPLTAVVVPDDRSSPAIVRGVKSRSRRVVTIAVQLTLSGTLARVTRNRSV